MVLSNGSKMARNQSKIVNRETFGGNKKSGLRGTSGVTNAVSSKQSNAMNTVNSKNIWLGSIYSNNNKHLSTKERQEFHLTLLKPEVNLSLTR